MGDSSFVTCTMCNLRFIRRGGKYCEIECDGFVNICKVKTVGRKEKQKKTSWNMYCFAIFPTGWSQCDWLFDSRLERCLFVGPCLVWCGAKPGRDKFEVDKVLSVFVRTFRNGAILISGTAGDLYVVREKSWSYWYSIVFILLNRVKKGLTNAFELLHNLVYTGPCDLSWNCVY